jgi:hypothetical protein
MAACTNYAFQILYDSNIIVYVVNKAVCVCLCDETRPIRGTAPVPTGVGRGMKGFASQLWRQILGHYYWPVDPLKLQTFHRIKSMSDVV